jgi:hypothetical protein
MFNKSVVAPSHARDMLHSQLDAAGIQNPPCVHFAPNLRAKSALRATSALPFQKKGQEHSR